MSYLKTTILTVFFYKNTSLRLFLYAKILCKTVFVFLFFSLKIFVKKTYLCIFLNKLV